MIDDQDEEETHVRITGPSDEAVKKALAMVQVLIDFNSEEGEAMRNAQLRELRVLNGTLQEDKDVDYKALFTNPQRAAITGPLGASAGIRAQLPLPPPPVVARRPRPPRRPCLRRRGSTTLATRPRRRATHRALCLVCRCRRS